MKTITLSKNKIALVDENDFDRLNLHRWQVRTDRNKNYYAQRGRYLGKFGNKYRTTTVQMHRDIMGISDKDIKIDHINGNTLDNRKQNLRIATSRENNTNLHGLKINNSSGYRGVIKRKDGNKILYRARINLPDGTKKNLGQFLTPEEAAKVFDLAAKEIYGEFCGKLNFE